MLSPANYINPKVASAKSTENADSPIKVAIADDHKLFIKGIAGLFSDIPTLKLCASFFEGQQLLDWYNGQNADIILMDWTLLKPLVLKQQQLQPLKQQLTALNIGVNDILTREQLNGVIGGSGDSCKSECRSGETCANGNICAMVNCMGVSPTTLMGVC